jgi:S-adenosylmethionine/arginine decarboxylase-like enzyme
METPFGPHLVGDLYGVYAGNLQDGRYVYRFLLGLADFIGLQPIGSPHLDLYSGPHEEWNGFSATIHIQTSHITMHCFDFGYVFIDIFSCKQFDRREVEDYVTEQLEATDARWQMIERGYLFPSELLDS